MEKTGRQRSERTGGTHVWVRGRGFGQELCGLVNAPALVLSHCPGFRPKTGGGGALELPVRPST